MSAPTNTCEDCHYFEADKEDESIGVCRRYPPMLATDEQIGFWPTVDIDDWCGEYKNGSST